MITQLLTPSHVAILLLVLLLIFGPTRLPQTGRALGRGLHEFKEGIAGRETRTQDLGPDSPPTAEPHSRRLHN